MLTIKTLTSGDVIVVNITCFIFLWFLIRRC